VVHTLGIASDDALNRRFAPTGGPQDGWRRPADLNNIEEIRPPRTNAAFQEAAAVQTADWGRFQ
jgi:hypothetical protein